MPGKPTLASDWLTGCAGCHMSLLDLDEKLLQVLDSVQLTSSPITDLKHPPAAGVDVGILEGAVNNSATEETAKLMRARCRVLVAMGDCAVFGGVPALRNGVGCAAALQQAYVNSPSTMDGKIPDDPALASMQETRPIDQVVPVDVYLPGCPPPPQAIAFVITELLAGRRPQLSDLNLDWH